MYSIGWLIRMERIRKKITQEQLCHGVCSASYLSKVENGYASASQTTIKMLLERLGLHNEKYIVYKDQREYELDQLMFQVRRSNALGEYEKHNMFLKKIKNMISESDITANQFYILHQCFIDRRCMVDSAIILCNLRDALNLTKPKINCTSLSNELLTFNEAVIINNIAIHTYLSGQQTDAIEILRELKHYYERQVLDYDDSSKVYSIVLSNLCKWIYQEKNYYECISLCDYSLDFAIKYNILDIVVDLSYYKGVSLIEIGQFNEGKNIITQAYYISKLTKAKKQEEIIKNVIIDRYDIVLD